METFRRLHFEDGTVITCSIESVLDDTGRNVTVGWSICNPKDRWDRKLGNQIALGRRRAGADTFSFRVTTTENLRTAVERYIDTFGLPSHPNLYFNILHRNDEA